MNDCQQCGNYKQKTTSDWVEYANGRIRIKGLGGNDKFAISISRSDQGAFEFEITREAVLALLHALKKHDFFEAA